MARGKGASVPQWAEGPSERQRNYASNLNEYDSHISSYEHLTAMSDATAALTRLRKIASLVKPIMRKRGWHVGTLTEFLPDDARLLGLNVNRGQKICIRLRYSQRPESFLPMEQCVDTMLHELSHIIHGAHDDRFHALWDELRDEHETLLLKGYTGEGFLSKGYRLGGGRAPPTSELRRLARQNAEQNKKSAKSRGFKLGGKRILPGQDARKIIADATARRLTIDRGCASGSDQADQLARQNSQRTVMTKADNNDTDDRAIAEAMLELMEAEEMDKLNLYDAPPGNMSEEEQIKWAIAESMRMAEAGPSRHRSQSPQLGHPIPPPARSNSTPPTQYQPYRPPTDHPASKLSVNTHPTTLAVPPHSHNTENRSPSDPNGALTDLAGALTAASAPTWKEGVDRIKRKQLSRSNTDETTTGSLYIKSSPHSPGPVRTLTPTEIANKPLPTPPAPLEDSYTWRCETCTCVNPAQYLACDACGLERPARVTAEMTRLQRSDSGSGSGRNKRRYSMGSGLPSGGGGGSGGGGSLSVLNNRSSAANLERISAQAQGAGLQRPVSMGWACRRCSTFMEHRYWTCSVCGLMKGDSRANEHVLS